MNADINRADHFGRLPLHVAAADNYPEMVHLLIEAGGKYSNIVKLPFCSQFINSLQHILRN